MKIKSGECFETETGFPARDTKSRLEERGGRYFCSDRFLDPRDK